MTKPYWETQTDCQFTNLEIEAMKAANIEGWYPWLFQAAQNEIVVTGAVCPVTKTGKLKGEPNYRRYTPGTKCIVVVLRKEVAR